MRGMGLSARRGRRRIARTTDSRHDLPVAPDLLDRNFTAEKPDQVWLADISLYLMAVPGRSRGTRPGQPGHFVRP